MTGEAQGELVKSNSELLQRASDEAMCLTLMSYHGVPWGYAADLNEDDITKIKALVIDLATALSEATGVPVPPAEEVL